MFQTATVTTITNEKMYQGQSNKRVKGNEKILESQIKRGERGKERERDAER
jgi:hypothetical protein